MRPIVNLVRGKSVAEALNILHYQPHKDPDTRYDEGELVVSEIRVDDGPRLKRFRPAARGRAHPILRRTCHLTVVISTVDEMEEAEA